MAPEFRQKRRNAHRRTRTASASFFGGGRGVGSIQFFGGVRDHGRRLEVSWIFAGHLFVRHSGSHEVHPDGKSGVGAGFFRAQRTFLVETYPNSAGDRWGETDEPCVGKVTIDFVVASERATDMS